MALRPGFAPTVPGLSVTEAPSSGQDLMSDMLSKLAGGMPAPRQSAGDKVAQAIQLLREAAQSDLRIAPLVSGAIQSLITGGPPGAPPMPASPVQGPAAQQASGGTPGAMGALAKMMGGGGAPSPMM